MSWWIIESRPYIGEEKNPRLFEHKNMVSEVRVDIKRVVCEGDKWVKFEHNVEIMYFLHSGGDCIVRDKRDKNFR